MIQCDARGPPRGAPSGNSNSDDNYNYNDNYPSGATPPGAPNCTSTDGEE